MNTRPRRAEAASRPVQSRENQEGSEDVDEWIIDISETLGLRTYERVKTGCICRVPERIRDANKEKSEEWYRPQSVAMGPIHRGATIDLQIMELTKWRYAYNFLSRVTETEGLTLSPFEGKKKYLIHSICAWFKRFESITRACYGDTIQMGTEEFARNMFLDACFLFELLLRLSRDVDIPSDLGHIDDDKKISRLLTDLMLLENQVPFFLLVTISTSAQRMDGMQAESARICAPHPSGLAISVFEPYVASRDFLHSRVCHFLDVIYLSYPDPYQRQDKLSTHPLQLHRCARKLQAFGITIKAHTPKDYGANVHRPPGTVASALWEFMDKFEFKIEFDETTRELTIPTVHIKEATEVKWRNFIAWEQIGGLIGVGYKFTSYAYFFKGLVCSVHDVQLLREAGVIKVLTKAKDEDLLIMFQTIGTGAKLMDGRYRDECEKLNKANVKGVKGWCVLILRMVWHYWQRFLEWLQHGLISMLRSFIRIYLGTPWKFIGVVSGTALLVLTIMQTIYAARSSHLDLEKHQGISLLTSCESRVAFIISLC